MTWTPIPAAVVLMHACTAAASSNYLVVCAALDAAGADAPKFQAVAQRAAKFHHADMLDFDGRDFEKLSDELRHRNPTSVLIVMPPTVLDLNFHRGVLRTCNRLDDDPLADF